MGYEQEEFITPSDRIIYDNNQLNKSVFWGFLLGPTPQVCQIFPDPKCGIIPTAPDRVCMAMPDPGVHGHHSATPEVQG